MNFSENDFYWRWNISPRFHQEDKRPKVTKVIEFFNTLSGEQQELIRLYGQSRYEEGNSDGYSEGLENDYT